MRSGKLSLTSAAREYGVDPRTVARLGAPALRKGATGRYAAKSSDSLLRMLVVPTREGLAEIATRSSREATQLAEYWEAVQWFIDTGDTSKLRAFRGKSVSGADGSRLPLITDPDELERLGNVGELSFESIYAKAA